LILRLLLIPILLVMILPGGAWCYDLLIVQSQRSPVYDEVLRGFRSAVHAKERLIVLSDYNEVDLQRIVREENPAAIITLGDNALAAARKVRQLPIISLMALTFRSGEGNHPALTGIEVQPAPDRYLQLFSTMKSRRVGIIATPARSGPYLRQARRAAGKFGIELVFREVKSAKEVTTQLESLAGEIDTLWMLPDSVTASGEASEAQFLFAAAHRLPVVTFSTTYLASGAALALELDRYDLGRQGGQMAAALLEGTRPAAISPETPRKTTMKTNPTVLRRLGIKTEIFVGKTGE